MPFSVDDRREQDYEAPGQGGGGGSGGNVHTWGGMQAAGRHGAALGGGGGGPGVRRTTLAAIWATFPKDLGLRFPKISSDDCGDRRVRRGC